MCVGCKIYREKAVYSIKKRIVLVWLACCLSIFICLFRPRAEIPRRGGEGFGSVFWVLAHFRAQKNNLGMTCQFMILGLLFKKQNPQAVSVKLPNTRTQKEDRNGTWRSFNLENRRGNDDFFHIRPSKAQPKRRLLTPTLSNLRDIVRFQSQPRKALLLCSAPASFLTCFVLLAPLPASRPDPHPQHHPPNFTPTTHHHIQAAPKPQPTRTPWPTSRPPPYGAPSTCPPFSILSAAAAHPSLIMMEGHGGTNATTLATITTGGSSGSSGSSDEEHFNLLLQIQQLQDKCTYLAGGTDGVQLTEVLMEKEEECRGKDRAILSLEDEMNHLSEVLGRMEHEKAALQGLVHQQGGSITGLTQQVRIQTMSVLFDACTF